MPTEYKVLFVGSMGAGKTTAIAAISDAPPVSTEAENTSRDEFDKATTTVALDYGEVSLPGGDRLRLYGAPGQARFEFMWHILVRGALGLVFLVDNSRPDPCGDLRDYLHAFRGSLGDTAAVVGIGRTESHPTPPLEDFYGVLAEQSLALPVFAVDVREREDVLLLVDTLFHQIEAIDVDMEPAR